MGYWELKYLLGFHYRKKKESVYYKYLNKLFLIYLYIVSNFKIDCHSWHSQEHHRLLCN